MSERYYLASRYTGSSLSLAEYGEIVKAEDEKWRKSYLASINPRSKTEVKEGTAPRRYGKYMAGGLGGGAAGYGVGSAFGPRARLYGAALGGMAGHSLARTSNLRRGDVKATNKRTGKQAKSFTDLTPFVGIPGSGLYNYR